MNRFINGLMGNATKTSDIPKEIESILVEGEIIESSYSLLRDRIIFTNKRLILFDKQGLSGRKKEIQSLAYDDMSRFSIETAGTMDADAEIDIYISSSAQPIFSLKFGKNSEDLLFDVYRTISEQKLNH